MPTFFRRFANLEALKSVSKANLFKLLSRPATKDYLARRGFVLPPGPAGKLDYEALAKILISPDAGMPNELVDDLHLGDEMSTEPIMLELLDQVPRGLLEFGEIDPTPADVALQLLLKDRKLLEHKRAEQFLHRSRPFRVCRGGGTQKSLPRCTERIQGLITSALGIWFADHGRGGEPRLSVFPRPQEGQLWILVQRGAAMRIQGTYDNGKPSSLTFRPQAFDLVVYYLEQDFLVVHTGTDTKGERDLYRRQIGRHLFGDEDYFAPEGNTTLDPLLERGSVALDCDGLNGIEWVRLRELEIYRAPGLFVRVKADDVFGGIEESHMILPRGLATKAVFEVKFSDAKEPRTITKYPPSRDRYERDDDRAVMEPFFTKNGYNLDARRRAKVGN
jgi:hypothetical protein